MISAIEVIRFRDYPIVDAPSAASLCHSGGVEDHLKEASVREVSTIALDLAKNVFQRHMGRIRLAA